MKILHITEASSAGVLTAVTTLARRQAFADVKHDISVAYVPRPDTPPFSDIQRMVTDKVRVCAWSTPSGPSRIPAFTWQLMRELRSRQYDVVHLHSSRAGFIGRLVAHLTPKSPCIVYSPHCFAFAQGHTGKVRGMYLLLEYAASTFGAKMLLCSPSELTIAQTLFPQAKTDILPNAIDHSDSQNTNITITSPPQHTTRHTPNRLSVVHIGRIAQQKAPALFAQVVWHINSLVETHNHDTPTFTWLGDGDRSLLPNTLVKISGWLTPSALTTQIAKADVVLFTSNGEGMPLALLEAQALGIPIVGSRVAGVVDVVEHGRTGFVATRPRDLADYTYRLLTDKQLRTEMSATARQRSFDVFDSHFLGHRSFEAYAYLDDRQSDHSTSSDYIYSTQPEATI